MHQPPVHFLHFAGADEVVPGLLVEEDVDVAFALVGILGDADVLLDQGVAPFGPGGELGDGEAGFGVEDEMVGLAVLPLDGFEVQGGVALARDGFFAEFVERQDLQVILARRERVLVVGLRDGGDAEYDSADEDSEKAIHERLYSGGAGPVPEKSAGDGFPLVRGLGKRLDCDVMGAQWKQKGREISALKRGQLFGKLMKEIVVAVKAGGPDPDLNARLHAALETARKHSVPRDTIERAVKKGAGQTGEAVAYELITYEGFAPGEGADHRRMPDGQSEPHGAGDSGAVQGGTFRGARSVAWMFEHVGLVEAHHPTAGQDLEAVAIEAGAQNVEPLMSDDVPAGCAGARFYCDRADVNGVSQALKKAGWTVTTAEMSYVAKNAVEPPPRSERRSRRFSPPSTNTTTCTACTRR